MSYKYRNIGFTLIEISVVLIILGLIAALAFPGLFRQIERNRGQEAMHNLTLIKSSIESCGVQNAYDFSMCDTWDKIGMDDPNPTGNTGNFTYYKDTDKINDYVTFLQNTYTIIATRTTSTDSITLTRTNSGVTCVGTGAFVGFC